MRIQVLKLFPDLRSYLVISDVYTWNRIENLSCYVVYFSEVLINIKFYLH